MTTGSTPTPPTAEPPNPLGRKPHKAPAAPAKPTGAKPTLPFTGFDLWHAVAAGLALLATGMLLRPRDAKTNPKEKP